MKGALRVVLLAIGVVAMLVVAWQGAIQATHVPAYLVPSPAAVWQGAVANAALLLRQTGTTLVSAALGMLSAALLAGVVAVGFTLSRHAEAAATPLLLAFRSAPVAAVAPLIMLATGRGIGTSIAVVTVTSFFPLFVNLRRGLASVDRGALELFHLHNAGLLQQVVLLRFPSALPYLFTGLRVAGGSAVLGAMLSEWITGARGLGNLILESADMREIELLWAAVAVAILLGLSVFSLTTLSEARATRWRRAGQA